MAEDDVADALSQLGGGSPGPAASKPAQPAAKAPSPRPARPTHPVAPAPPPPVAAPAAARPSPRPEVPQQPNRADDDDDELVAAEIDVDDESGDPVGEAAHPLGDLHNATPPATARYRAKPKTKKSGGLKATMAPVLITVGVLLLIPAVWATLLLAGVQVPLTDRDDATTMAKIMLCAWPLSVILITAGIVAVLQVMKQSR